MKLVVGATGFLGSEICRLLTDSGQHVRGMIRETSDPVKLARLEEMGVELVKGDLRNPGSFASALDGAEVVITTVSAMPFSYIPGDNNPEKVDQDGIKNLIDAAVSAGVKHFIHTSFSGNLDMDFPLRNAKRAAENHLKQSGMTYTILRPSCFMEAWLSAAIGFDVQNGKVQICGEGTNPISYISLGDVAKFAVESITNPSAKNVVLELGGPDKLSQLDAVRIFERATGRKFEISKVPVEVLLAQMNSAADPMERSFAGLMYCVASGDPIDMEETADKFGIRLKSVKEYAGQVVSQVI